MSLYDEQRRYGDRRVSDLRGMRSDLNLSRLKYDMAWAARIIYYSRTYDVPGCDALVAKNPEDVYYKDCRTEAIRVMTDAQDHLTALVLELISLRVPSSPLPQ